MPAQSVFDFASLQQTWAMPSAPRPITILGAGGIVRDGHLPAYRRMGLPVAGVFDVNAEAARKLAADFDIPVVHQTLDDTLAACGTRGVFDLALPPAAILQTVEQLPEGSIALIQKPLGPDGAAARQIVDTLQARSVTAATNFQLRFTPSMLAIRDAVRRGLLGDIVDVEVRLAVYMPWELWSFIPSLDAVEIPLHSIHYLDWIRSLLGEPESVFAKAVKHPRYPTLADARSSIILDYGDRVRCALSLNHTYNYGPKHVEATIRVEGTKGAAHLSVGYLIDYNKPVPEKLEFVTEGGTWTELPLKGERVPDAFGFVMANLQRFAAGEDAVLDTDVRDSVRTMALVDAALKSSRLGGVVPE
ncbi:putative dehydrogenase [Devosia subaequoris]|uniref:Putative dehydrogenase n=1 Tax=Devosia subaequoris TaxID=395930 RepID=A0A7W6NCZ2_9HYPH|nr:Gfo/Idh/MocA family oxidoreductase [Devosia subaequoris]MBB4053637.1 putative dehydrogenase [Devosia subaequoris]MCP1211228.1 Gfo/Idh/MocA family oxidoreductase [Devosia subaequoris]